MGAKGFQPLLKMNKICSFKRWTKAVPSRDKLKQIQKMQRVL